VPKQKSVKLGCWNVNSLKVRLEHLAEFLTAQPLDILALQETKTQDEQFPIEAIRSMGYQVLFHGQKTYNGVAILSKQPMEELSRGLAGFDDPQARVLTAKWQDLVVVDVYVPNGQAVGSDKYAYKLKFLDALRNHLQALADRHPNVVVMGDFNIAPEDRDVHDPKKWVGEVLVSADERQALGEIIQSGFRDVYRQFPQEEHGFSWWDYRKACFERNAGLRIDLILASTPLAARCVSSMIDRLPRSWERPSDHTPVIAEFSL
jgi:exodeoxyribonuclease III